MFDKSIEQWLSEYGESHRNPRNKIIHWICVPVILWCVLALLWPLNLAAFGFDPRLNGATLMVAISLLFYVRLSWTLTLGMALISGICLWLIVAYQNAALGLPLWAFALALFVVAWIGQFVGHKIEGKKPSFFKDVQFLLIGPAWLLSFVYQKAGIPLHLRRA